jgi:hypothetical protein
MEVPSIAFSGSNKKNTSTLIFQACTLIIFSYLIFSSIRIISIGNPARMSVNNLSLSAHGEKEHDPRL